MTDQLPMELEDCKDIANTILQNEGFDPDTPGSVSLRLQTLFADAIRQAFLAGQASRGAGAKTMFESQEEAAEDERLHTALAQIAEERARQDANWGGPDHDDSHERRDWLSFIIEHVDRAKKVIPRRGPQDLDEHRKQLVEIGALAVAAIQAHDRDVKR